MPPASPPVTDSSPASSRSFTAQVSDLFAAHENTAVAVLVLIWLMATFSVRALSLPDEGRYVGVAWEMLRSGQWLTPTLDGLPYFHKPPLFYWITAISIDLFGTAEWAARIAPLTGAFAAVMATHFLLRRWTSAALARWTVLILATSPLLYGGAQYANHDMLVAGMITASIAFAADAVLSLQAGLAYRRSLLLAWAAAALGLLTKGLIGVVLPGGVIIVWLLTERRLHIVPRLLWWPAPLLFALIAAPWFVLMQHQHPGFVHYFFIHQQFQRFTAGGFNNMQPFWFYPAALAVLNLPWIVLLTTRFVRHEPVDATRLSMRRLLWIWLILIVLFFSIPKSKLLGYVLPVLPALAALIAEGMLQTRFWGGVMAWRRQALLVVAGALCVGAVFAIAAADTTTARDLAKAYRQRAEPGQPLIFVNVYPFDFIFYGQIAQPVAVLENWDDAELMRKDSWRKELGDAGEFAPALGKQLLLPRDRFPALLCQHDVSWVMMPADAVGNDPRLAGAESIGISNNKVLLRINRHQIPCPSLTGKAP